eukprot:scaffold19724_cov92-Isochrysis_galbana.AAC.1
MGERAWGGGNSENERRQEMEAMLPRRLGQHTVLSQPAYCSFTAHIKCFHSPHSVVSQPPNRAFTASILFFHSPH